MFAAMPSDNSRQLEFFRLALSLVGRGKAIPSPLTEHFEHVLRQAREIAVDPTAISPDVSPQAVHLANDLRRAADLRAALEGVVQIGDVSQDVAQQVLRSLEPHLASSD
jgi:hypothetical protein